MSNLDMKEAIKMLAAEKNISEETLLQVLVEALATAYKRRPGSAEEVEVGLNTDTLEISFTAFDIDEDGNWVNQRDDTPDKNELGRIAAQTFRQVMGQRIREAERDKEQDCPDDPGDDAHRSGTPLLQGGGGQVRPRPGVRHRRARAIPARP